MVKKEGQGVLCEQHARPQAEKAKGNIHRVKNTAPEKARKDSGRPRRKSRKTTLSSGRKTPSSPRAGKGST